ncbi:unnamed protein product [Malus baccata var. baccata]
MLLGMFPENWLFDKSISTTSLNFPISSESGPTRELDDKFRCNIWLSSHKEDGILEVNKLDPNVTRLGCLVDRVHTGYVFALNAIKLLKLPMSIGMLPLMLEMLKSTYRSDVDRFPREAGIVVFNKFSPKSNPFKFLRLNKQARVLAACGVEASIVKLFESKERYSRFFKEQSVLGKNLVNEFPLISKSQSLEVLERLGSSLATSLFSATPRNSRYGTLRPMFAGRLHES